MVRVKLGGPLMSQAGGTTEFEVEAATIRDLLARLGELYPQLRPVPRPRRHRRGRRHHLPWRLPRADSRGQRGLPAPGSCWRVKPAKFHTS